MIPAVYAADGLAYWTLEAMVYAHCVSPPVERDGWQAEPSRALEWVGWLRDAGWRYGVAA